MSWQLKVLGEALLVRATTLLRPERKTAAVLTYLALEGATHRSKIAGLLWSDSDEKTARNNLAQVMRRLKTATDAVLVSGDDVLSLTGELSVDAAKLKVLSFEGSYQDLLGLGGELLGAYDYDDCPDFGDWLFAERERIATLRKDALTGEMLRLESSGELREALEVAEALLQQDTLSEEAHRQIMRLHYLLGDRAAALRAFERCKDILARELGVEPTRETEQLAKQIEDGNVETQTTATTKTAIPLNVLRPPLVGRESELTHLADIWNTKKIAFVRGEPGVGKSRLIADFLADKTSVRAEGRPGDALPFASYARAVRQWLRHHEVELPSWVKRELSRLDPSLSDEVASNDILRLSEAVTELLRLLNANNLQALVMDDLQFMDTASFELSRYLLSTFVNSELRILASYRSGEVSDETSLIQFVQAGQAVLVDVKPLETAMTARLLEQIHISELKHLGQAMQSSTGGNPMFIIETIKHLIENKRLDISPDKLPSISKVSSLIQKRLEQLSTNALRLAQMAAVAGTDFDLDLASTVLEIHLLDLAVPFSELENKQVMRGQAFVHDLLFETAIASIPAPIKMLLDLRIARVLNNNGQSAKAAQHYLDSRSNWQEKDIHSAITAFVEVARSISFTGDLEGGKVWFDHALGVAPDKPSKARILVQQARLLERHLHYPQALKLLEEAEKLALAADAVTRASVINAKGTLLYQASSDLETTSAAAHEVLNILGDLNSDQANEERATALNNLGIVADVKSDFEKAEHYYRQALELRRKLSSSEKVGESLKNLGVVLMNHKPDLAQMVFEEAISIWERLGHQSNLGRTYNNLGSLHWRGGQLGLAENYFQKAIEASARHSVDHKFYNNLGGIQFLQGKYRQALSSYVRSLDSDSIQKNKEGFSILLWDMAEVELRLGMLEEAESHLEKLLTLKKSSDDFSSLSDLHWLFGDLYILQHHQAKAIKSYQTCVVCADKANLIERKAEALARQARLEGNVSLAEEALTLHDAPSLHAALQVVRGDYKLARETIQTLQDPFEEARLLLDIAYLTQEPEGETAITAWKLLDVLQSS